MNSYVKIAIVLCCCIALTTAQFGYSGYDGFFNAGFDTQGYSGLSAAAARDPRANTGPVVFPPSPPGDPSQTSGVVVGASGYGFVPAGSQGGGGAGPAEYHADPLKPPSVLPALVGAHGRDHTATTTTSASEQARPAK